MTQLQAHWEKGYQDGWGEQGAAPTLEPRIPPMPSIPADVLDPEKWAYDTGKSRGGLDRVRKQAGL